MSNVKWNSNNYYSKTYDYDNLGRNTNTYITYLENEKLQKKKIQEIEYRNLYDENNHLIGIQKSVKILTSEETFDMITYEYDKYDRLFKIYKNNNTISFDSFQNVSWCEVNSKIEEFEDPYFNLHYFYTYLEVNFYER